MAALGGHHRATRSLLYPTGRAASSEKPSGETYVVPAATIAERKG